MKLIFFIDSIVSFVGGWIMSQRSENRQYFKAILWEETRLMLFKMIEKANHAIKETLSDEQSFHMGEKAAYMHILRSNFHDDCVKELIKNDHPNR